MQALAWLFPWLHGTYPGRRALAVRLFGNRVTWETVRCWKAQGVPLWAMETLIAALDAKLASGKVIHDALADMRTRHLAIHRPPAITRIKRMRNRGANQ